MLFEPFHGYLRMSFTHPLRTKQHTAQNDHNRGLTLIANKTFIKRVHFPWTMRLDWSHKLPVIRPSCSALSCCDKQQNPHYLRHRVVGDIWLISRFAFAVLIIKFSTNNAVTIPLEFVQRLCWLHNKLKTKLLLVVSWHAPKPLQIIHFIDWILTQSELWKEEGIFIGTLSMI